MANKSNVVSIDALPSVKGEGVATSGAGQKRMDGGLDGAARLNRNTALWNAPNRSADEEIARSKGTADPRARDQIQNNGYVSGAIETYKDTVVGSMYRLNAKPDFKYLGLDQTWADEFKDFVESNWNLYAEGPDHLVHAAGRLTASEIIRIMLAVEISSGDAVMSSEWLNGRAYSDRPFSTAYNIIDPNRLCNPKGLQDSKFLRGGVEIDRYGRPLAFNFRNSYVNSTYPDAESFTWTRVPARKPWGRKLIMYYSDIKRAEQTRSVSRLVSAMKEMRMLDKYSEVVLQNAILNATFAATIESELPRDIVFAQLGEISTSPSGSPLGAGPLIDYMTQFLAAANEYQGGSKNLALDGVRIPHLLPGTKLQIQNAGNPGGVGTDFEASFQRHFSRAIGMSHEEFSGNFADSNYSSSRAAMTVTGRTMRSVKRFMADACANDMFSNFVEELLNREGSNAPMPRNAPKFYERMNRQAFVKAEWIGSAVGQIDEMKETQAAILRINAGVSTREDEAARLGKDWKEIALQLKREKELYDEYGLPAPQSTTQKDTGKSTNDKQEEEEA